VAVITGEPVLVKAVDSAKPAKPTVPFPADSLGEATEFQNAILAKSATTHYFGKPLGSLQD